MAKFYQAKRSAEKTIEHAQRAFTRQTATTEVVPLYADCGNASLTLWEGLTYYHLHHHERYSNSALASLRAFGELQPTTKIPERFRLECLNNRTLAAIQAHELEEAIICLEAGKQGAKNLKSKQRTLEVEYAYHQMLRQWPKEKRLPNLQKLADERK